MSSYFISSEARSLPIESTIFTPDGRSVGRVSSGAYGYTVGKSLAVGFANPEVAGPGDEVEIMILGLPHKARILAEPAFDAAGTRLRG